MTSRGLSVTFTSSEQDKTRSSYRCEHVDFNNHNNMFSLKGTNDARSNTIDYSSSIIIVDDS